MALIDYYQNQGEWSPLTGNTSFLEQMRMEREAREAERMRREAEQRQQQQQQQGAQPNMNIMDGLFGAGYGMMGGGAASAGGGAGIGMGGGSALGAGSAATSGVSGVASSGGASSAAGGSGGGMGMGALGWWALLAAAIAANESAAEEDKARSTSKSQWAGDILSGRVFEQDMSKRWLPKIAGESLGGSRYANDDYGLATDAHILADISTGDFSNAWDALRNDSSIARLLGKIF